MTCAPAAAAASGPSSLEPSSTTKVVATAAGMRRTRAPTATPSLYSGRTAGTRTVMGKAWGPLMTLSIAISSRDRLGLALLNGQDLIWVSPRLHHLLVSVL